MTYSFVVSTSISSLAKISEDLSIPKRLLNHQSRWYAMSAMLMHDLISLTPFTWKCTTSTESVT